MIRIWGRRSSFNVQKVMWLVGELGLDHEHVPAGGDFGRLSEPGFLALNPHGRIPVLEDGALAVWESHAILRYLAARYGGEAFWPSDPAARSGADQWMEWAETTLQPAFLGGVFWGFYRTPEDQRNWPAIHAALGRTAALMILLDRILADRPFLCGDTLTLGDIPAGAMLYRYHELDIERPDLPNLAAWYGRLQGRAAYREHVMVPFEELRGRLDF